MRDKINLKFHLKVLKNREFEGYGSTFGNVDLGGDVVMAGAFQNSLEEHKADGQLPQMYWMHQPDRVPGKWISMEEDNSGLYVKGVLAPTELGDEMHTLLGMKAVRGLSIGFRTKKADYNADGIRMLKEIDLWEVSLVSLGMNPAAQVTSAKARLSAYGEYVPDARELERIFRDAGFSQLVSKRMISVCKTLTAEDFGHRDDDRTRDVDVESEAAECLQAIEALSGSFAGAALKRH